MTNREGEMPSWAIPAEWKDASAISSLGVVLHGQFPSPPCCKVIHILNHYGVKYTAINGAKKDSEYKKIPVLLIGDKQINDSAIIAAILSKVLCGEDYSEKEKEIEKLITTGLMLASELVCMENTAELQKCGCAMGGCIGSVLWSIACCIPCLCGLGTKMRKSHPELKSVTEYAKELTVCLGEKPFFHGDTIGVIDCSLYGVMSPFQKSKSAAFSDFISADDRLRQWHDRMSASPTAPATTPNPAV